jgi:tetratricopeptide (TPR) repeat protein
MYNLLISLGLTTTVMVAVMLGGFPFVSALLPGILVFPVAMFLLARRTGKAVQDAMLPLQQLLQDRKVDEAKDVIATVRDTYAPWQFLLHGQLTAQLGMLAYLQMNFDEARPLLEAANGRDWSAQTALGCLHYRKGQFDDAWKSFESASSIGSKESIVYIVWATLLTRKGERSAALKALSKGLEALPDHPVLRKMKNDVANKTKLDTSAYPETWYQFFPEDAAQMMAMRGRRGPPPNMPGGGQQRMGPPQPRQRGKLARRR